MNNNNCILVEFVNEENSVAVGYRDWLETKSDDVRLQSIINKETIVQIQWPLCEIKSALPMKKIIKGLQKKDWISAAVKIHAFGEWTVMHKQLADLQKFNIANPCKEDRKTIMKKSFGDSDCDDFDQKNKIITKKRTDTKDKQRFTTSEVVQQDILSQIKTSNVNLKDDVFTLSDKSDETPFTDDSNICESKSKKTLYLSNLQEEIKILKTKNKQLQNEIKALRHKRLITLENKIENLDKIADKLAIKIHMANKYLTELNENMFTQVYKKTQESYSNVKSTQKNMFQDDQIHYNEVISVINVATEHDNEAIKVEDKYNNEIENIVIDELDFKEVKELKQCNEMHDILQKDIKEQDMSTSKINTINDNNETMISIGRGITISQSMMQNVRTNDIGKMTCDLMSCLFTNKEIAFSSRTGKKNNKTKVGENVIEKKPLDTNKLLAMKAYVLGYFKNTPNGETVFNNTVSNKCKNVARNYK